MTEDNLDFEREASPAHDRTLERLKCWANRGFPHGNEELIVRELMDRVVGVLLPMPVLDAEGLKRRHFEPGIPTEFVEALTNVMEACKEFESKAMVRKTIWWVIRSHNLPESVHPQYPILPLLEELIELREQLVGREELRLADWQRGFQGGTSRCILYLTRDGLKTHSWSVPHNEMAVSSRGLTQNAVITMELVDRFKLEIESIRALIDQLRTLALLYQIVQASKGKYRLWIQLGVHRPEPTEPDASIYVSLLKITTNVIVETGYSTEVGDVAHERTEPVPVDPSRYLTLIKRFGLTEASVREVLAQVKAYTPPA